MFIGTKPLIKNMKAITLQENPCSLCLKLDQYLNEEGRNIFFSALSSEQLAKIKFASIADRF